MKHGKQNVQAGNLLAGSQATQQIKKIDVAGNINK
jgi:hypothetical protein